VNMSDRFIDGFYWLTVMGMPAENGVDQINRQDVAGWSFPGLASNYMLAGPPGWTNGSALLRPHPDWYITVLWKQLMGNTVLNFTWTGDSQAVPETTIHAFCTSSNDSVAAGSVTIAYVVGWQNCITLSVPSLTSMAPRVEYILTSTASEHTLRYENTAQRDKPYAVPESLYSDTIYLNGALMQVNAEGLLPQFPVPGNTVNGPNPPPLILPAYSYGYIVFPAAKVAACM